MSTTNSERVKKSFRKYARPTITIEREKNEIYKKFVADKGYQSLNDYFNSVLEYDIKHNIVPLKNDLSLDSD